MKLAVVTGASSGIGAATARLLAERGYRVVLVARNRDALEQVAKGMGDRAVVEACDASDGAAIAEIATRILDTDGAPDVIVNCAGAGEWKSIEDTSPHEAVVMMQAPYFAAFNVTHAFMHAMLAARRGVIVHVGSPASMFPWPQSVGYAAARWALRGLNEALSQDLAGTGVHSCHVIFGRVTSQYFERNAGTAEKLPRIAAAIPTMSPEQCAVAIARIIERPRREALFPFMLRLYHWSSLVAPWLVRLLVRATGAKRAARAL